MSVSSHLNIRTEEYDARIRTFVPFYEEMLTAAAGILNLFRGKSPTIVDLGIGTGELAHRCLAVRSDANLIGIDIDPWMLNIAKVRLERTAPVNLVQGDFREVSIPQCDAIVSCIALHHVKSAEEKRRFYKRCARSLRPGGLFVSADCFPARDEELAMAQREAWLAHLGRTYSREESEGHLASWAAEDFYFPLPDELQWLQDAGFMTEIVWRRDAFAVLLCKAGK